MFNKLWTYLDGKKRDIAGLYWFITVNIMVIWFPAGLPGNYGKLNITVGIILTALGYGHALYKSKFTGTPQ